MDEKKLLELYEKLKQDHGLTRTYDEFSISMGDENYRSKIFNFVKSKSTSEEQANRDLVNYFGDTNYDRWNYQNFGELEKTEVTLDDPVKVTDSNLLTIQGNKTSPLPERRISKRGTPGTRSRGRNIGAYTQSIIDENKKKQGQLCIHPQDLALSEIHDCIFLLRLCYLVKCLIFSLPPG